MMSPRFFGDDVLESCIAGHRMFAGSGDPLQPVALVQQALADLGFSLTVDGLFGPETGATVSAYKHGKGLIPNDPIVGAATMAALDADFAHELFDTKADDVAGTRFDLGSRIGTRDDPVDGFATCEFQNGICVEAGHAVAYAMPASVQAAWLAAGGLGGSFGMPIADPLELDANRSVQEFAFVAHVFGGAQDFVLPRDIWEASISGGSMIGLPLDAAQAIGIGGASFVPHDQGVVLAVPEASPQPLPQAVFDAWAAREAVGTSLGAPSGFAFPGAAGTTFPFQFGNITTSDGGVAAVSATVAGDLQRFFQPGDDALHLTPRITGSRATAFIGGEATFAAMRADIASTHGPADFVYILSWHCNLDFPLLSGDPGATPPIPADPTSTLRSLLDRCAFDGVQVRAMLWAGDPVPSPPTILKLLSPQVSVPWQLARDYARMKTSRVVNEPTVRHINSFAANGNDGAAILDDRHRPMGSHHQKVLVIGAGSKLIAYLGGIEANIDRIPPPVAGEGGSPLFDISVRLEDAGAFLALETFILRWDLHPGKLGSPLRGASVALPLPVGGPMAIQVTHTYGRGFPLASAVQTASTALCNGIKNARQFFYMEDQYFVGSDKMATAINDALSNPNAPNLVGIVVIAAENSVSDLPDLPFRRRAFLGPLAKRFPGRLLVFERLGSGSTTGPTAYVHSKLLIVDDEAAFVGSVNSNRRSWFHDSEIDATIVDTSGPGGIAPGARGWVRDFRCALWARHFNFTFAQIGDFATCLTVWRAIISGQLVVIDGNLVDISGTVSVRPYDVAAAVPRYSIAGVPVASDLLQLAWNTLEDPA